MQRPAPAHGHRGERLRGLTGASRATGRGQLWGSGPHTYEFGRKVSEVNATAVATPGRERMTDAQNEAHTGRGVGSCCGVVAVRWLTYYTEMAWVLSFWRLPTLTEL